MSIKLLKSNEVSIVDSEIDPLGNWACDFCGGTDYWLRLEEDWLCIMSRLSKRAGILARSYLSGK